PRVIGRIGSGPGIAGGILPPARAAPGTPTSFDLIGRPVLRRWLKRLGARSLVQGRPASPDLYGWRGRLLAGRAVGLLGHGAAEAHWPRPVVVDADNTTGATGGKPHPNPTPAALAQ